MKGVRHLLLIFVAVMSIVISASGSPPSEPSVEELKKKQEQLEKATKETKEKKGKTEEQIGEKTRLMNQKERELEQRRRHQRKLEQKLAAYQIQMNYIGSLIPETAENLGNLRELARKRLRELYKEGTKPFMAYLLEAKNDVDFVDRVFYARLLIAHDHATFSRLKGSYSRLQMLSQKYDQLSRETASLKGEVENEAAALKEEIKKFEAEKKKLLMDLRAYERALEEQYEQSRAYAEAIRRLTGEGRPLAPFNGAFKWPLKGRISSGFGMRFHPILKRRIFHTGIDIALPKGFLVTAAASGTVISAEYKGGYGLTVVILHGQLKGDSYSTLYSHLDEILVEEGTEVEVGDPIGKVGSTGLATGPHLHFEVRVNGDPVNPIRYLP